jgi:ketosteroid isomerase-like protein
MQDTQSPLDADRRFFAALLAGDAAGLERLLVDDFAIIDVMSGTEHLRAAFIDSVRQRQVKFEAIEPSEVRLRLYPGTALVTGRTEMRGRFGDAPFTAQSRYTHVYLLQDGAWRLAGAQGTPIANR